MAIKKLKLHLRGEGKEREWFGHDYRKTDLEMGEQRILIQT